MFSKVIILENYIIINLCQQYMTRFERIGTFLRKMCSEIVEMSTAPWPTKIQWYNAGLALLCFSACWITNSFVGTCRLIAPQVKLGRYFLRLCLSYIFKYQVICIFTIIVVDVVPVYKLNLYLYYIQVMTCLHYKLNIHINKWRNLIHCETL